ncbi:unnamed protein product [Caenorhabditis angaria]|uniref:Major facilitator superfamily (MFS) profile domain-containing protein n=1 Tax=Caenorhabditis angaria TaxID=860376 RepID=A0A9P1MZ83_9PELO|nr:unnamed protein product [Caenorhabditis angaria]
MTILKRPGEYEPPLGKIWNRAEARTWTTIMFSGTCVLYAARAALPISAAAVSKEFAWNKTDSGTVLSCFFWGYALTQMFAGRLADKYGAENILPYSSLAWTMITFFTPTLFDFAYWTDYPLVVLLSVRILTGICQAFHIPSLASIVSKHLAATDKGRVFGIVLAGSHCGTVLAGLVGSTLLEWVGWRSLFQFVGVISLIWCWMFRWVLENGKNAANGRSSPIPDEEVLLNKKHDNEPESHLSQNPQSPPVPWGTLFRHPGFWAAAIAQYTGGNSYSILFNWLPSYFHETYPNAKGIVYNVVPSLAIVVTSLIAPIMASQALADGKTVTYTRKLMEGASLFGIAICLLIVPMTDSFWFCLLIFTLAMAARGLHHGGVSVNPHDFAPNYAGSVFGVFNACGAITGFVGVYVAGHILEATNNNWAYVFVVTSAQCVLGAMVYILLGTGQKII